MSRNDGHDHDHDYDYDYANIFCADWRDGRQIGTERH
jgi:hypothetical protein